MIVFSSVSKQFLPDSYALKDLSFEVHPGELILLTGPSGSGKTTVMKLLTKEYDPTGGNILFHDADLNEIKNSKLHEHRRKIGVVFQDYKLISELNIWENIALPLSIIGKSEHEIEERVTDLLELVSLTDKAMHFPQQLSGGEAQRISIARALSTAPAIVFADEPTGNLDKENSLQIASLLSKINKLGTTVLFATHDHDVIDLFNKHRHIVLENGKLVSDSAQEDEKVKEKSKSKPSTDKKDYKEETDTVKNNKADTKSKKTESKNKSTKKLIIKEDEDIKIELKLKPQKTSFWAGLFGKKKKKISLKETGTQLELNTQLGKKSESKSSTDKNEEKSKEETDTTKNNKEKTKIKANKSESTKNKKIKEDPDAKKESKSRKTTKKKNTKNNS